MSRYDSVGVVGLVAAWIGVGLSTMTCGASALDPAKKCEAALDSFVACGGDLVGTWVQACTSLEEMPAGVDGCPSASATLVDGPATTMEFDQAEVTVRVPAGEYTYLYSLPAECLADFGQGCQEWGQDRFPAADDLRCEALADRCDCIASMTFGVLEESHAYTVDGDVVTVEAGQDEPASFCIQGDELHLYSEPEIIDQPVMAIYKRS